MSEKVCSSIEKLLKELFDKSVATVQDINFYEFNSPLRPSSFTLPSLSVAAKKIVERALLGRQTSVFHQGNDFHHLLQVTLGRGNFEQQVVGLLVWAGLAQGLQELGDGKTVRGVVHVATQNLIVELYRQGHPCKQVERLVTARTTHREVESNRRERLQG